MKRNGECNITCLARLAEALLQNASQCLGNVVSAGEFQATQRNRKLTSKFETCSTTRKRGRRCCAGDANGCCGARHWARTGWACIVDAFAGFQAACAQPCRAVVELGVASRTSGWVESADECGAKRSCGNHAPYIEAADCELRIACYLRVETSRTCANCRCPSLPP